MTPAMAGYLYEIGKIEAALNGTRPSSSSEETFQLAVFTHDELSPSNGFFRINEERCKLLPIAMVTPKLTEALSCNMLRYQT